VSRNIQKSIASENRQVNKGKNKELGKWSCFNTEDLNQSNANNMHGKGQYADHCWLQNACSSPTDSVLH
jgi:hypothetical protein